MFNYNLNEKNYVLDVANDSYKDILCKYTSTKSIQPPKVLFSKSF